MTQIYIEDTNLEDKNLEGTNLEDQNLEDNHLEDLNLEDHFTLKPNDRLADKLTILDHFHHETIRKHLDDCIKVNSLYPFECTIIFETFETFH